MSSWSLCHWPPPIFSLLLPLFISSTCPQTGLLSLICHYLHSGLITVDYSNSCLIELHASRPFPHQPSNVIVRVVFLKNQFHYVTAEDPTVALNSGCFVCLKAVNYLISSYLCDLILCFFPAFFSAPRALISASLTASPLLPLFSNQTFFLFYILCQLV